MKNFNELYEKIYTEKNGELETLRKKKLRRILILICVAIFIAVIVLKQNIYFLMPCVFIMCIIIAITIVGMEKKYNYTGKFKKEIIGTFIKEVDENLNYYPERGITPQVYRNGEFEQHFDRYHSEDLIEGILDDKYKVYMAEVLTQDESTDSEGNTTTTTLFHGIFGMAECSKVIPHCIRIHSDKGFFGKLFGSKNKIEMDSSEFEKNFDVYGTNPIMVMQILTSDIMEMLVEFKKTSKIKYELTIKGNQIYIRFHTGEVFEPKIFKNSLDYDTLKRYYDIIEFIFKVTKQINKVIEETEI